MQKVNVKLGLGLLGSLALLGAGLFALHYFQAGRIADALLWQAQRAEKKGDLKGTARYLRRYLEFAPQNVEERAHLARLLAHPKLATTPRDCESALFVLEQVVARDPQRHELRRPLARLATQLQRFDLAREHLDILQKNFPKDGEVQFLLGQWHEAQEKYVAAGACYRQAIALAPRQTSYQVRLATLLRQQFTQGPEAQALVDRALEQAPHDAGALLLAAGLAEDKGQLARRAAYLEQGCQFHRQNADFYNAGAALEIRASRPHQAIRCLRAGIKALPGTKHRDLLWTLSNQYLDMNEPDKAQPEIANLRKIGLLLEAVQYLEARCCICRKEWAQAVGILEHIRPKMEPFPTLTTHIDLFLGQGYEQLNDPGRRLAAYERAVKRDPRSIPARMGLACTQADHGHLDDALDQYQRLVSLPGVPSSAWTDYARLLIMRNRQREEPRWEQVVQVLKLAKERQADQVAVTLLQAELLTAQKQVENAEVLLLNACGQHPKRIEIWLALSALAENRGEFDKAEHWLDKAKQLFGDKVVLRLAFARLMVTRHGQEAAPALVLLTRDGGRFSPVQRADLLVGLAEARYRLGDSREAAQLLGQAVAMPHLQTDLRLRLRLFDLCLQAGDNSAAGKVISQVRRIEGDEGTWWRYGHAAWLVWQVKQRFRHQDRLLDEAHHLLEEVAERRPSWSAVPLTLAEVEDLRGNHDQARVYYRQATRLGENSARVIRQLVYVGQELAGRGERSVDAEQKLRQAVVVASTVPETWASLIRYLVATGQTREAESTLHKARLCFPANTAPLALAQCHEAMGQMDQAQRLYREALESKPADVRVVRSVAGFYMRNNLPLQARPLLAQILNRQLQTTPGDLAWASRALAVVLATGRSYKDFQEALHLVGLKLDPSGKAITVNAPPPGERDDNQRARARVLAAQGGKVFEQQAIAWLEDLSRRRTLQPEDQYLLAVLHEGQGDRGWLRARDLLRTLVLAQANNSPYLAHFAQMLVLRGEVQEAEQVINKLVQLEAAQHVPEGAWGSIELKARVLEVRGQHDAALALLRAHAAHQPIQPQRLLALAGFLARRQRLGEALDQCERAWKLAPPELIGAASVALLRTSHPRKQDCARVERLLKEALDHHPTSPLLLIQMGDLQDLSGHYQAAEECYVKARDQDPDNIMALNNLAWLLAQRTGNGTTALPLIERAIRLFGPRPELLDTRAVVHLAQGRPRPAIADLKRATQEAPSASRYFHLARALHMARQDQAALKAFQKAKASGLEPKRLHPMERGEFRKMAAALASSSQKKSQ